MGRHMPQFTTGTSRVRHLTRQISKAYKTNKADKALRSRETCTVYEDPDTNIST
jgi:hypothetical protein